jgi:hypothetical protein
MPAMRAAGPCLMPIGWRNETFAPICAYCIVLPPDGRTCSGQRLGLKKHRRRVCNPIPHIDDPPAKREKSCRNAEVANASTMSSSVPEVAPGKSVGGGGGAVRVVGVAAGGGSDGESASEDATWFFFLCTCGPPSTVVVLNFLSGHRREGGIQQQVDELKSSWHEDVQIFALSIDIVISKERGDLASLGVHDTESEGERHGGWATV